MDEEMKFTEREGHRKFAADLFNLTWKYLEKTERTPEDVDTMINATHASRYHWSIVGDAQNLAIGEWQISRVYAVLDRPEAARYHAERCLAVCVANGIGDFSLAYAYEALARAAAIAGDKESAARYKELGRVGGKV